MSVLTQEQTEQFWRDGFLMVEDAVTGSELAGLRDVFAGWVDESRKHDNDYGET
ncbi:MAG: phytanoyl-CoA dioxygenase family protein, partial [Rhizobiales bacterium]|nr:phytanoyl-CoA dioxygenase family protein [Hyphomicrobiales bacterium]